MDLALRGKRALITAASRGLGRACAQALAGEGAQVFVSARGEEALAATAAEIGAAGWQVADMARAAEVEAVVDTAVEMLGGLDILVSNVGGPPPGWTLETTDEQWEVGFQQVLMSAVRLVRFAMPALRRSEQGRIVLITSITGRQPIDALVLSNAFRPAVTGMAKTLSREVGSAGITVNCIAPESVMTDRVIQLREAAAAREGIPLHQLNELSASGLPLGRDGRPEEVGALCAFLCSAQAGFITGQTVGIDGGGLRGIH